MLVGIADAALLLLLLLHSEAGEAIARHSSLQALIHGRVELTCPKHHNSNAGDHDPYNNVKWRRMDGVMMPNKIIYGSNRANSVFQFFFISHSFALCI